MRDIPDINFAPLLDALRIEEIRAGRHITRNEKRHKIGELWVNSAWYAVLQPSFHPRIDLACVQAREEKPDVLEWHRSALRCKTEDEEINLSAEITFDPVADVISDADLLPKEGAITLDGIAYYFWGSTLDLSVQLAFGNPSSPRLQALERAFLELVETILESQQDNRYKEISNILRKYIEG